MSVIICADDFGLTQEVNAAITDLAGRGTIHRTSILANESVPYSKSILPAGLEYSFHANFLSFTKAGEVNYLSGISTLGLLVASCKPGFPGRQLIRSLVRQWKFIAAPGITVSCIDTHQHTAVLPCLCNLLVRFAQKHKIRRMRCITMQSRLFIPYIRLLACYGFTGQIPKMLLLYLLGLGMKIRFDKAGITYAENCVLMPLASGGNFEGLLREILQLFNGRDAEIVTHPGFETNNTAADPYLKGRKDEYAALLHTGG